MEELGHVDVIQQKYRYTGGVQERFRSSSSAVSSSEGAGMREQLMERGRAGCDAVWQVLETG